MDGDAVVASEERAEDAAKATVAADTLAEASGNEATELALPAASALGGMDMHSGIQYTRRRKSRDERSGFARIGGQEASWHEGAKDGGNAQTAIENASLQDVEADKAEEEQSEADEEAIEHIGSLHRSDQGFRGGQEVAERDMLVAGEL